MKTILWIVFSISCFCEGFNIRKTREPQVFVVTPETPPPFLPTPLPEEKVEKVKNETLPNIKSDSRSNNTGRAIYSRPSPDLVFADFKASKDKSVSSVKEMLSHERVKTTKRPPEKKEDVQLKDVWDIIRHNQKLEEKSVDSTSEKNEKINDEEKPVVKKDFSIETVDSVSGEEKHWIDSSSHRQNSDKK